MEGLVPVIVVGIVVLIIGVALWLQWKRRQALQEWADRHGLTFDSSTDRYREDQYPELSCLRRGGSRKAYNTIRGEWNGRPLELFDYQYTTGSGKNKSTHYMTVFVLSSAIPLQNLEIRPENFFDKITEFVGFDDIDFESAEFSREFHVKAADKRWAFDVLHPRAMQFLLDRPRCRIQFASTFVASWHNSQMNPTGFEPAIETLEGLLEMLPDYLKERQRA